jgi:cell division protein FtsL
MATNSKKQQKLTPGKTEVKNSVAKGTKKGLMDIAEVRMVLYVVPIAIVLAVIVYILTH